MSDASPGLMVIFGEALERADPADRAAYLDRACGADAVLREQVEVLLAAHVGAGGFLELGPANPPEPATHVLPGETRTYTGRDPNTASFAPDGAATGAFTPDDSDRTGPQLPVPDPRHGRLAGGDRIGTVIAGRYTLVEVVGEGGMGSVYLASQSEPVKRQVALKLIKSGMDSKAVLARFDAERQALALMDHPNIARIYDGGVTPAGQPFFVMELVKGVPLTDYCDAHRLTVTARLELFVVVCQAVQHAHQKGIIHRDLKPGNVLVTEVDGRPTAKVIDFGVAKATEQKLTDLSFSDLGAIVGTPAYMSPEQADPSSMDIDTRTDVYALGVMLYELLTGSPPIDGKQFKRGAILEMLRMVREVEPPRPSTRLSAANARPNVAANRSIDPAKLSKLLQGELDWVVMKALDKDRTRRYETANAFARDVHRYLADEVVEARPPSRGYRLKKFVKRNKGQVFAASLVFLTLVAGIVGTGIGMAQARQANRDLADKNTALEAERAKVEQRFEMARKAIAAFHTTVEAQPELGNEAFRPLRTKLLTAAAGFYRELEGLLAGETDTKSRTALADGYFQLAELINKIGDEREALAVFSKALAIRRELAMAPGAGADARLAVSVTLRRVGIAMATTGDAAGARRALEEARDVASTQEVEAPTDAVRQALADSHHTLGWVLEPMGKPAEALAAYRKALAIRQGLADTHPAVTDYHQRLASSHNSIGLVLRDMGKPAEALAANEQALAIRQRLANAHPTVPEYRTDLSGSHNNIGNLLRRMGKPAEALAAHKEALAIRQGLADAHPAVTEYQTDLAQSHDNVGNRLGQAGKLAEALASYEKAREIRQRLADTHPTVTQFQSVLADSHHNIGIQRDRTGQPAEAMAAFEKARDIYQKLADAHPTVSWFKRDLASSHKIIGIVLDRTGKPAEALAAHKEALAIRLKLGDAQPTVTEYQIDLASSHDDIGNLLSRTGKPGVALEPYQRARDLRLKLVDAHPADTRYQIDLAWSHNAIANVLSRTGKPADALASYQKARDIRKKLADAHPTIPGYQSDLARADNNLGRLLAKEGRFAEAFAALDAGLAIRETLAAADTKSTKYTNTLGFSHAYRGWARVRAGQPKEASADLRKALELWAKNSAPDAEDWFETARALALLAKLGANSKSGVTADEAKGFADRAAAALADAVKAGWAQPAELREPDFDAVRDRTDLRKLVEELEAKAPKPAEVAPPPKGVK